MRLEENPIENYAGVKDYQEKWFSFFLQGLLLIGLGALAIIFSNWATLKSIRTIGALLGIGGVLQVGYSFWARKGLEFVQHVLFGLFYTTIGFLIVSKPTISAIAVTLLLASFYTVTGLFKVVLSVLTSVLAWRWLLVSGLVSLAVGLLIWAEWPSSDLSIVGVYIGIDLIFFGFYWVMLSLKSRGLPVKK